MTAANTGVGLSHGRGGLPLGGVQLGVGLGHLVSALTHPVVGLTTLEQRPVQRQRGLGGSGAVRHVGG
ncbi:hypothetical protein D3C72_2281810 [compost metagenome]